MIVAVHVAAALSRPPRDEQWSRVVVSVPVVDLALGAAERAALLTACHMVGARPGVVMVTRAEIADILAM